jgi:hypothetical protein
MWLALLADMLACKYRMPDELPSEVREEYKEAAAGFPPMDRVCSPA